MNKTPTDCGLCRDLKWLAGWAMNADIALVHCDRADVTALARVDALGQIETPDWCPLRRAAV